MKCSIIIFFTLAGSAVFGIDKGEVLFAHMDFSNGGLSPLRILWRWFQISVQEQLCSVF